MSVLIWIETVLTLIPVRFFLKNTSILKFHCIYIPEESVSCPLEIYNRPIPFYHTSIPDWKEITCYKERGFELFFMGGGGGCMSNPPGYPHLPPPNLGMGGGTLTNALGPIQYVIELLML